MASTRPRKPKPAADVHQKMADLSDQAGEDENAMLVRTIESDCWVSTAGLWRSSGH
jgi:hypothetical protein